MLVLGPRGSALVSALLTAEADQGAAGWAWSELEALPTLPRRRVLASYGALHAAARGYPRGTDRGIEPTADSKPA